jgi:inner membrane protein
VDVGVGTVGSHILADALTPAGVRPFAPYREDYYSYDAASASNPITNYAVLGVGLLSAALALVAGTTIAGL